LLTTLKEAVQTIRGISRTEEITPQKFYSLLRGYEARNVDLIAEVIYELFDKQQIQINLFAVGSRVRRIPRDYNSAGAHDIDLLLAPAEPSEREKYHSIVSQIGYETGEHLGSHGRPKVYPKYSRPSIDSVRLGNTFIRPTIDTVITIFIPSQGSSTIDLKISVPELPAPHYVQQFKSHKESFARLYQDQGICSPIPISKIA
jgi:hypothetical protein